MDHEKDYHGKETRLHDGSGSEIVDEEVGVVHTGGKLSRDLKNRHMQSMSYPQEHCTPRNGRHAIHSFVHSFIHRRLGTVSGLSAWESHSHTT